MWAHRGPCAALTRIQSELQSSTAAEGLDDAACCRPAADRECAQIGHAGLPLNPKPYLKNIPNKP